MSTISPAGPGVSLGLRCYSLLLLLYPGSFRRRFEREMNRTFDLALRSARRRGPRAVIGIWVRTLSEVSLFAALEWWDRVRGSERRPGPRRPPRPGRAPQGKAPWRDLFDDTRLALRGLWRRPGFTVAALCTLALGVGANTAVFSVVYRVLWRPLSYDRPEELVALWPRNFMSVREMLFLRENSETFDAVAGLAPWTVALSGVDNPTQLSGARTSANLFEVLGVPPALGRTFRPDESDLGSAAVAVLSHGAWRSRFGADTSVIGRTIYIDGRATAIVGVMPPDFEVNRSTTEVWLPLVVDPDDWTYQASVSQLFARRAGGASLAASSREFSRLVDAMRQQFGYPDDYGDSASVVDLKQFMVGGLRVTLFVLFGAVGFILLIAGSNLANLLLARGVDRRREMAMRTALGATRGRLVRLLMTEASVLSLGGGVLGLALAFVGVGVLKTVVPTGTPRLATVSVDGFVLLACLAISLGTGLLFSLIPAWGLVRVELHRAIGTVRSTAQGGGGASGNRTQHALVVAQIALAVTLVVGAALMVRTIQNLTTVHPGFVAENLLTLRTHPTGDRYRSPEQHRQFYQDLLVTLRAIPQVDNAAAIQHLPLSGWSWGTNVEIEGHPVPEGSPWPRVGYRIVTDQYFETMKIPLLMGRTFTALDNASAQPVGIVNQTLARRLWPSGTPVGTRVRRAADGDWITIVGVVGDVHHGRLDRDPGAELFLPHQQSNMPAMMLSIRTTETPMSLARQAQREVWDMDADVPISNVMAMTKIVSGSVGQPRMMMVLLSVFAGVALLLGIIGVYGVTAFTVRRRTEEFGIRMALGASGSLVRASVLRHGITHALLGVGIGLAGASLLTRFLHSFVFGVSTLDVTTFAGVGILMLLATAAAIDIPARRATRVDPAITLRES